ncbi:hypothetical protein HPC37_03010 [Pasteurellaceae bacterium 20609_3]|uniref:hypothetical protein n=1 Tax=Spirabiliibacterium mucosae TaxID=28156 RepID=UPI001AAD09DF|nr:hypothetical protein [Spirabiliibacterium mucosae]MBE2897824.1 hypothetical protein [Spirabiliibacterium mucosae]
MAKQTATANVPATWTPVSQLPTAAQDDVGLGNENVSSSDIIMPRLKLLQQMSPEVTPGTEKYIEGARAGLLLNSLTGEVFPEIYCVNMKFKSGYTVWRKRNLGGGLYGAFETEEEARNTLSADPNVKPDDYDVVESHTHALLIFDETLQYTPILCDMESSKLKFSRQWNSHPKLTSGPRFASIWKLSSKPVAGPKGNYFTYDVEFAGYADDAMYEDLKAKYTELGFDK